MKPSDPPRAESIGDAGSTPAKATYSIDGAEVSEQAFRAREAELEIDSKFLEGEMMDGFVQIRKARERGTGVPYEHVLRSTASEGTAYAIRRCASSGC